MSVTYSDAFGDYQSLPSNAPFNEIDFNANLQLLWPSQSQNPANTVTPILKLVPSQGGLAVALPNATLVGNVTILVIGGGANSFSLTDFDGTQLTTVNTGEAWFLILEDNSTQAGTWIVVPFAQGNTVVTSVGVNQPAAGMTIVSSTQNPITSTGNFTFAFTDDLGALEGLATTGIAVRTALSTWTTRQLTTPNNNLVITNSGGINGNFIIGLNADLTNLNSVVIGNILIQQNAITALNLNGVVGFGRPIQMVGGQPIQFLNNAGTFYTALSGPTNAVQNLTFTLPSNVGANTSIMQTDVAGNLSFSTLTATIAPAATVKAQINTTQPIVPGNLFYNSGVIKAWALINGTTDPITLIKGYNIAGIFKNGVGQYGITFTNPFIDVNYSGFGNASNTGVTILDPTALSVTTCSVINSGNATVVVTNNANPPVFTDYSAVFVAFIGDFV